MAEECRNCRFSRTAGAFMHCRRYPPVPLPGELLSVYPFVAHQNWCGEWLAMRPGAGLPPEIAPAPRPRLGTGGAGTRVVERS